MDLFNIINLTMIAGLCYCIFHIKKSIEEDTTRIIIDTPPKYTIIENTIIKNITENPIENPPLYE